MKKYYFRISNMNSVAALAELKVYQGYKNPISTPHKFYTPF